MQTEFSEAEIRAADAFVEGTLQLAAQAKFDVWLLFRALVTAALYVATQDVALRPHRAQTYATAVRRLADELEQAARTPVAPGH